jgi:uncharacterized protein (DUF488 family)
MNVFTMGFTKKSAETFFETLRSSGATHIVDVRLNNVSQLAGFTKARDLEYFLHQVCEMGYKHVPLLAPTKEILDQYRKQKGSWQTYEKDFLHLMAERRIEELIPPESLRDGCLLCSEDQPHFCHRRLVAEYLRRSWGDIEIKHL